MRAAITTVTRIRKTTAQAVAVLRMSSATTSNSWSRHLKFAICANAFIKVRRRRRAVRVASILSNGPISRMRKVANSRKHALTSSGDIVPAPQAAQSPTPSQVRLRLFESFGKGRRVAFAFGPPVPLWPPMWDRPGRRAAAVRYYGGHGTRFTGSATSSRWPRSVAPRRRGLDKVGGCAFIWEGTIRRRP